MKLSKYAREREYLSNILYRETINPALFVRRVLILFYLSRPNRNV